MSNVDNSFQFSYELGGFAVTDDPHILNLFNSHNFGVIENIEIIPGAEDDYTFSYNQHQRDFLKAVTDYLSETYLSEISHQLIGINIWSGVDVNSREWHCDNGRGQDFSILYYLDTSLDDGALYFKSMTRYNKVYPAAGTLVMLKQTPPHYHKADPSKKLRRIIHVEYKLAK